MEMTKEYSKEFWMNLTVGIRNENERLQAWEKAAQAGPAAILPLSKLLTDSDFEVVRAAKRGLWRVARKAGQPGKEDQRKNAANALLEILRTGPSAEAQREILWILSEIGREESIPDIAALLSDKSLCDDARMALERIPIKGSLQALQDYLPQAPLPFRYAIAHSLRVRGINLPEYPTQNMVPANPFIMKAKSPPPG